MLLSLLLMLGAAQASDPVELRAHSAVPVRSEAQTDGLFTWRAVPPVLVGQETGQLELRMTLPQGFLVYRDALRVTVVSSGALVAGAIELPEGTPASTLDPDHPVRDVLGGEVVVRVELTATAGAQPGLAAVELRLDHQGCFDGRCLPPDTQSLRVFVPVRAVGDEPATCPLGDD